MKLLICCIHAFSLFKEVLTTNKMYDEHFIYQTNTVSPFYDNGASSALLKTPPNLHGQSSKRRTKMNPKYHSSSESSSFTENEKLERAARMMGKQLKRLSQKVNGSQIPSNKRKENQLTVKQFNLKKMKIDRNLHLSKSDMKKPKT